MCAVSSRCTRLYPGGMQRAKQYCTHQSTPHEERQLSKRNLAGTRHVHVCKREKERVWHLTLPQVLAVSRKCQEVTWSWADRRQREQSVMSSRCSPSAHLLLTTPTTTTFPLSLLPDGSGLHHHSSKLNNGPQLYLRLLPQRMREGAKKKEQTEKRTDCTPWGGGDRERGFMRDTARERRTHT